MRRRKSVLKKVEKFIEHIYNSSKLMSEVRKNHNRRIEENCVYEVSNRMLRGLPLIPSDTMNMLVKSSLGVAQKIYPTTICYYMVMPNHYHMILIPKRPEHMAQFYGRFEKELTERIKRLFEIDNAKLWNSDPMVGQICDIRACMKRILYLFANPQRARLVDRIEEYPGVNNFSELEGVSDGEIVNEVKYIRCKYVKSLKGNYRIRSVRDREICKEYEKVEEELLLKTEPDKWVELLLDEGEVIDVEEANRDVIEKIRRVEKFLRYYRKKAGKGVMGAVKLKSQVIDLYKYAPKKSGGVKVRILCSDVSRRVRLVREYIYFLVKRYACAHFYVQGYVMVPWPPGSFKCAMPYGVSPR